MKESKMKAGILGTGHYVPDKILNNAELEKIVDTSDEWITERTGIKERHIAGPEQATSDLCYEAAIRALENAGMEADRLDAIIVGTATPDMNFPATACIVQARLGVPGIPCMDMEAACPGFIYGLEVARGLLSLDNSCRNILVIGSEMLTKITDWTDRNTCVLFGDGAGAVIVSSEQKEGRRILSSYIGGDGRLKDLLNMPGGGSRHPATHETVDQRLHFLKMKGREVFKHAVLGMEMCARKALERAGLGTDDVAWLIPHQANIRIIKSTGQRLEIPEEQVYVNIHRFGNTSAASIPIALDEMNRGGMLNKGDILVLVAFGAGFTWGATVVEW
jgi:3-oxoacyl-[acyl-carrier-protein] synthase-3